MQRALSGGQHKNNEHDSWVNTAAEKHLFGVIALPEITFYREGVTPDFLDILLVKETSSSCAPREMHELLSGHLSVILYLNNDLDFQEPHVLEKLVNWYKFKNILKAETVGM